MHYCNNVKFTVSTRTVARWKLLSYYHNTHQFINGSVLELAKGLSLNTAHSLPFSTISLNQVVFVPNPPVPNHQTVPMRQGRCVLMVMRVSNKCVFLFKRRRLKSSVSFHLNHLFFREWAFLKGIFLRQVSSSLCCCNGTHVGKQSLKS